MAVFRARLLANTEGSVKREVGETRCADSGMPLQFVATYDSRLRGLRMAEKTIAEKAAETVGYGLAMAEDVAGSVRTAVGAAMTTVTKALKKAPPKKAAKKVAKKV